jgi:hypothetical protein
VFLYDCALSLYELYGIIVALRLTFLLSLLIPSLGGLSLVLLCLDVRLQKKLSGGSPLTRFRICSLSSSIDNDWQLT